MVDDTGGVRAAPGPGATLAAAMFASPRLDARGWLRVGVSSARTLARDNFTLIAAGCAFYALLALAPALAALGALYGFFSGPAVIAANLDALADIMPAEAHGVLVAQAAPLTTSTSRALGLTSVFTLAVALWSARAGVRALMDGVAVAYRASEGRGFLIEQAITYALTALFVVLAAITVALVVAIPAALRLLPLGDGTGAMIADILRWPLAMGAVGAGLALLYRFGPPRNGALRVGLAPGVIAAVAIWLAASVALSVYLQRVGDFNATYGALGAVAALLVWFWLSALAALVGAVVNAELERAVAEPAPA